MTLRNPAAALLVVCCLSALAPGVVSAQPSPAAPADPAEAQRHFELGLTLMQSGHWDGALVEFNLSLALFRTRSALFNRAMCLKQLNRPVEALATLREWRDEFAGVAREEERRAVDEAEADVRQYLGELLVVVNLSGATVTIDGELAGRTPIEDPIPVAVGHHDVEATREGYEPARVTVAVGSRESASVGLTLTPVAAERQPEVASGSAAAGGEDGGLPSAWFWATAGTAVALGLGGAVTGALVLAAEDDYATARDACAAGDRQACADGPGIVDDYDDYQLATNVLLFSAGAFAATALVLGLLTDWGGDESAPTGALVTAAPLAGPAGGAAGFALGLRVPF